jgi:wyosine [tRNA(Phe)-imidazoG37] synthetase (radical SAM superfamily)
MRIDRGPFFRPDEIVKSVKSKMKQSRRKDEPIDYLTFVPDGEPTLDANLGFEIDRLKSLGIKVAVITNGSLIYRDDVKADLMKADWVSLKLDSTRYANWRKINRPHRDLKSALILKGMLEFSEHFRGKLVTETMLVDSLNIDTHLFEEMAQFIARLNPAQAYLAIPTRPPAENWVGPPEPEDINAAFQVFHEKLGRVEYLIGYEGDAFAFTGNVEDDLLSITAVHPMRESAVIDFLEKAAADWSVVEKLMTHAKLVETKFGGQKFYLRNLKRCSQ